MEVRSFARNRASLGIAVFALVCGYLFFLSLARVSAAEYTTTNFVVTADTESFARQVAETAENSRRDLAIQWLGVELPAWSQPCPIQVKTGPNLGAGGETSFTFKGNEVFGWRMKIQGTRERVVDSVIPHEVSHMILASYFRQPVPRWIDEGAATSTEAVVERNNYRRMLIDFLSSSKGIPFNTMVDCTEYPADLLPFYAQGFSVCEFLILVGGHRRLIEFAKEGMLTGNWSKAVARYYNFANMDEFQTSWNNWVSNWYRQGMPAELPQVAKVDDYPYDITGRLITGGETMVASAAQLDRAARTRAAVPAGGVSAGIEIASNDSTVSNTAASNTALTYQGSYGQPAAAQPREMAGGPRAPARDTHAEPVILGQEPGRGGARSSRW